MIDLKRVRRWTDPLCSVTGLGLEPRGRGLEDGFAATSSMSLSVAEGNVSNCLSGRLVGGYGALPRVGLPKIDLGHVQPERIWPRPRPDVLRHTMD